MPVMDRCTSILTVLSSLFLLFSAFIPCHLGETHVWLQNVNTRVWLTSLPCLRSPLPPASPPAVSLSPIGTSLQIRSTSSQHTKHITSETFSKEKLPLLVRISYAAIAAEGQGWRSNHRNSGGVISYIMTTLINIHLHPEEPVYFAVTHGHVEVTAR